MGGVMEGIPSRSELSPKGEKHSPHQTPSQGAKGPRSDEQLAQKTPPPVYQSLSTTRLQAWTGGSLPTISVGPRNLA
jgi:hypothetical protein